MVFCKKVRENPATSDTPIIMQTAAVHEIGFVPAQGAAGDSGNTSGKKWLSADEILTKPVALDLLLKKIELHLSGRDDG